MSMSSDEIIGSGEDTGTISEEPTLEPNPNCDHSETVVAGEQHDYDESIDAYKVSLVIRCASPECGAEVLNPTDEEVPVNES